MRDTELYNRIRKAWAAFNKYRAGLCNGGVSLDARLELFDSVVSSTVLYASGTWTMTKERQRQLRTAHREMLRKVLGIQWDAEGTTNCDKGVLGEDDILHAPKLPTWGGVFAEDEAEALLSFLAVPAIRVSMCLDFFAQKDRIPALLDSRVEDLLWSAVFCPGPYPK